MRAIIFGAKGTLGQALLSELPASGYTVVGAFGRRECDIRDEAAVYQTISDLQPDVVFNAAAFTDVDGSELQPDEAYMVNALAPEFMARACAEIDARFVHYSTDFVFDGELERPYDEFDVPAPQGIYARSKLAGERLVQAATPHGFVIRVGWLYGRGGKNFPSTILRRLKAGESIRADQDRLGSPTWVVPVAHVSAALARTDYFGLYHGTAQGETSWADYAVLMADLAGVARTQVIPLPSAALVMRAPRPRRAVLDNRMLRLRGLDSLGDWQTHARAFFAAESSPTDK